MLLGLLFLIGSRGQVYRIMVGVCCEAAGAVAIGFGLRVLKKLRSYDPDVLRDEILRFAREHDGQLSEDEIRAELGDRFDAARNVIAGLIKEGTCRNRMVEGKKYLVFEHLLPVLAVRRCEYCGAELPLDENLTSCPNCGGTIKTSMERLELGDGEYFDMDDRT